MANIHGLNQYKSLNTYSQSTLVHEFRPLLCKMKDSVHDLTCELMI